MLRLLWGVPGLQPVARRVDKDTRSAKAQSRRTPKRAVDTCFIKVQNAGRLSTSNLVRDSHHRLDNYRSLGVLLEGVHLGGPDRCQESMPRQPREQSTRIIVWPTGCLLRLLRLQYYHGIAMNWESIVEELSACYTSLWTSPSLETDIFRPGKSVGLRVYARGHDAGKRMPLGRSSSRPYCSVAKSR